MADKPPLPGGCRYLPCQVRRVPVAKRVSELVKLTQRANWLRRYRQVEFLQPRAPHGHESISGRCSGIAPYLELAAGLYLSGELADISGPVSGVSAPQQGGGRFFCQVADDGVAYCFSTPGGCGRAHVAVGAHDRVEILGTLAGVAERQRPGPL